MNKFYIRWIGFTAAAIFGTLGFVRECELPPLHQIIHTSSGVYQKYGTFQAPMFNTYQIKHNGVLAAVDGENPVWMRIGKTYGLQTSAIGTSSDTGFVTVTRVKGNVAYATLNITEWMDYQIKLTFEAIGLAILISCAIIGWNFDFKVIKRNWKETRKNPFHMTGRFKEVWDLLSQLDSEAIQESKEQLKILWNMYNKAEQGGQVIYTTAHSSVENALNAIKEVFYQEKEERIKSLESFANSIAPETSKKKKKKERNFTDAYENFLRFKRNERAYLDDEEND